MKYWDTYIIAIDPWDGEQKKFSGPIVPGLTRGDALKYCQNNGLGYLYIDKNDGPVIKEISTKKDDLTPDWTKQFDYSKIQEN